MHAKAELPDFDEGRQRTKYAETLRQLLDLDGYETIVLIEALLVGLGHGLSDRYTRSQETMR